MHTLDDARSDIASDEVIAHKARRAILAGGAVVLVGILGTSLWLAVAPLAGAVIAPGTVKVDLNRKPVQHLEGGTVRQVMVRDGQKVGAGDVLVILSDVSVDANLEIVRTQLASERVRQARLVAEQSLQAAISLPQELRSIEADSRLKEILVKERALFETRRASLVGQIDLLRRQAVAVHREIASFEAQIKADRSALQTQRDELAQNQSLQRDGFISRTRLLSLERAVADYESRLGEHQSDLARAQQKLLDTDLRIASQRDSYASTASSELKQVLDRVHELEERWRNSADAAKRQQIVAPVAGEVVNLKFTSPGTVVAPRETLLEIVPEEPRLVVEIRVRPEDASYVHKGSAADIRFTSYPYRTTPLVTGKVIHVSADRVIEQNGAGPPYFQALVEADRESLREAAEVQLMAGLPTEVYVRTRERSALTYLLDPLTAYLQRAMREK